ncbi:MAG: 50S ribosomal protein L24 [Verrucomicrobiota bacterium JB023]|nr:50S ribosomal protein L24 [Verrucomicrobiota bacterium JB023]
MSRPKTHVKAGDNAVVVAGNHKGKSGKVLSVNSKKQQVILEGVRPIKKAIRRSEADPEGGIVEKDGPIHLSNVKKAD